MLANAPVKSRTDELAGVVDVEDLWRAILRQRPVQSAAQNEMSTLFDHRHATTERLVVSIMSTR